MPLDLSISPLTPDMHNVYRDFFLNRAKAACLCIHFHWNDRLEAKFHRSGKGGDEHIDEFVKTGVIRGYFAYINGEPVGWCNANDKRKYDELRCGVLSDGRTELWDDADIDIKVKSAVCFLVLPEARGQGVATALLNRVITDAAAEGYACVEGYPLIAGGDDYANHHGPLRMFENAGFTEYKRFKHDCIMRKYL